MMRSFLLKLAISRTDKDSAIFLKSIKDFSSSSLKVIAFAILSFSKLWVLINVGLGLLSIVTVSITGVLNPTFLGSGSCSLLTLPSAPIITADLVTGLGATSAFFISLSIVSTGLLAGMTGLISEGIIGVVTGSSIGFIFLIIVRFFFTVSIKRWLN